MKIEKKAEGKIKYKELLALIDQLERNNVDMNISYIQADNPNVINYTLYNMGIRVDIFNLKLDIITSLESSLGFIDINFPQEILSKSSHLSSNICYIYCYEPDYGKLSIETLINYADAGDESISNNMRKRKESIEIIFTDEIGETTLRFNCSWKLFDSIFDNINKYTEELLRERAKILYYDKKINIDGFWDSIDNILENI